MHAGFLPLRRLLPMNMWRPVIKRELTPEAAANVQRIEAIWNDCRARFGQERPFLFGRFGAADAMYAPVVARLHTYAVAVGAGTRAYMDAVMALPAWREWHAAAVKGDLGVSGLECRVERKIIGERRMFTVISSWSLRPWIAMKVAGIRSRRS